MTLLPPLRSLLALLLIGSCLSIPLDRVAAQAPTAAPPAADSAALIVVRRYFAAYNAHDVEAVLRLLSPDISWLSVAGDSVTKEAQGIPALRSFLTGYFQRLPSARSDMEAASVLGPWVTVRERARWTNASGMHSQASMSVYEVRDGLLRRVWYYPEVR